MQNLFNMDNPVWRALGRLADLMILNLIFIICCIPVVTIGAALTGMSYVTLKMAEGEDGYVVKGFFKSFKQNFKQATIIWIILLLIGCVLGIDLFILAHATGSLVNVFRIVITATIFLYLMVLIYVFPVLCRFYNPIKTTIRNAFIMAIADFPRTILMLVVAAGSVVLTFFNGYTIVYGTLVWLLCGFALVSFANAHFMKKVFAKYMPKDEEETDPDNWVLDETPQGEAVPDLQQETPQPSPEESQEETPETAE